MFTVAIINPKAISQFLSLPVSYVHNGVNYRITFVKKLETVLKFNSEGYIKAYDLAIVPTQENHWGGMIYDKEQSVVYLNRVNKVQQQLLLTQFFAKTYQERLARRYRALKCFPVILGESNEYAFEGKGIIKPSGGARSLGVMTFDTAETNLRSFFIELRKLRDSTTKTNENLKVICDEFKIEIKEAEENSENEVVKSLFDETILVQEFNEYRNVKELRILKTADCRFHIFQRDHFDTDCKNIIDKEIEIEMNDKGSTGLESNLFSEISNVIKHPEFPLTHGSIDVWYSDEDNRWGIYEYQPQYGHRHIPERLHSNFLRDTIETFANAISEVKENNFD